MTTLLAAMQTKDALTYNGAVTNSTSLNACVDMFFLSGASRAMKEQDCINIFVKAYAEDPGVAMKILFWSRDCRGGAGERNFFQYCYSYWLKNYAKRNDASVQRNLNSLIPEYGYWKDLVKLGITDPFVTALKDNNGLAAKWTPRKGIFAELLREKLRLTPKQYRKYIVGLSNTVEQKMCAREWDDIKYSAVPSVAFQNYKKAYERHDAARFNEFISAVEKGDEKVNAGQLFPYQLYQSFNKGERADIIDAQWKALPNYLKENNVRMIPVCDVSGSMTSFGFGNNQKASMTPMDVSVSLGVYLSEKNEGPFKDAFITFSDKPTLQVLKGTVTERFRQLQRAHWAMSTNIEAVFALILAKGLENDVPAHEMPNCVLIISDMEFNACARNTAYEAVKKLYVKYGYELPKLVFWNVNGRVGNVPVQANTKDVALVSGASPAIVRSVLTGEDMTPKSVMLKTVMSERYEPIKLG